MLDRMFALSPDPGPTPFHPLLALQDSARRKAVPGRHRQQHPLVPQPERTLCCKACNLPVTEERARISVAGASLHCRRNPVGVEYEFGCFDTAPGCRDLGEATLEHTWFAGYRWRISVCAGCHTHLGWHFDGGGHAFYGLIAERLRTVEHPGLH